jgi:hypothetical protein
LNKYELIIKCKSCREGDHHDCSGGNKGQDNILQISCTCLFCKKERIAVESSDNCGYEDGKNGQTLESVGELAANASRNMQPSSQEGFADNDQ